MSESFVVDYLKSDPQPVMILKYLLFLRKIGFKPKVVYDIGAYSSSFADLFNEIFPDARVILIDASEEVCDKLVGYECYNVCLSNNDDEVDFYELMNVKDEKVKSIYQPKTFNELYDKKTTKKCETLTHFIKRLGLPEPNFVRIDCCGAEKNIFEGGITSLLLTKYLLVSLQNDEMFLKAPDAMSTGPYINSVGFEVKDILDLYNTPIIDYVFENKNI